MKRFFISFMLLSLVLGGLLAGAPAAHAQTPASLTAAVDRDNLTTDEILTLTLSLDTPDFSMPQLGLPSLDGFQVVGTGQTMASSMVNGYFSLQSVYTFQLKPLQAGVFTIPGFKMDWNGQTLSSDPIRVTVTQGNGATGGSAPSAAPAPAAQPAAGAQPAGTTSRKGSNDQFIETSVDKPSLYVGEPLRFMVRLYNSASSFGFGVGQPSYEAPKFVGFWHPQKPAMRQGASTGSNGMSYDVTEVTTWLFPTSAGLATIDPATVTVDGGWFSSGSTLTSDPLTVDVKPLPDGAPANFSGAVGQFEIKATADANSTRLGEPVTLQVELSGAGNWGTLGDPQWPSDTNWRSYSQDTQSQNDLASGQMTGKRVYKQFWTPLAEGPQTIPAISYSYFDPAAGQYRTVSTQPQTINVAPGDPRLAASAPQAPAAAAPAQAAKTALAIKAAPAVLTSAAQPLSRQTGFRLLFLLPLGLVAVDLAFAYRKRYLRAHAADLRRSKAFQRARKQLQRIPRRSQNVELEVSRILLVYLEDLIQQPLAGLSHSALAQVLQAHAFSPELAQRVTAALFAGEATEYTPRQPGQRAQVLRQAGLLLEDLEKCRS